MECNITQCEWYGFGSCCNPEQQLKQLTPNDVNCVDFFDIKRSAAEAREALIQDTLIVLKEIGFKDVDLVEQQLRSMNAKQLLKSMDLTNELWSIHQQCKTLDVFLQEVQEIGVEAFKEKYGLTEATA